MTIVYQTATFKPGEMVWGYPDLERCFFISDNVFRKVEGGIQISLEDMKTIIKAYIDGQEVDRSED